MKKYKHKSAYPSKTTSKLRWFKPALINKQGQGPSKEWLKMLRKDATRKLASSIYGESVESKANSEWIEKHELVKAAIRNRKRVQATDESVEDQHIYHVTHTKHVPKIQKHGLRPMQTSNWVKAGNKERYGSGEVYTFTHKDDAHQWAGRMDWAHNKSLGSGNISIVTMKKPKDHKFEVDTNDPLSQAGQKGKWLKTNTPIAPHHIVAVEPYHPRKLGEEMKDRIGKPTPSVDQIAKKHGVSADAIEAQIAKGIAVEREHTNSDAEAHEIARDHLDEFPDYYDRLDDMEKKAKKDMKESAKKGMEKLGFKMMKNDPPVPASKKPHPTPKGYRREKDKFGFNVLRKEDASQYNPDKTILKNRMEAHKALEQHMTRHHGAQSPQAAFHRYYVDRIKKELEDMNEDAVPNSVGGGNVAGMPTADTADTSVARPIGGMMRRKKFAGKTVFVVDPTTFHKAYLGKRKYEHYEKYLEGCDIAEEIREYGRTYWQEPIILENEQTGAMVYLKYGSK